MCFVTPSNSSACAAADSARATDVSRCLQLNCSASAMRCSASRRASCARRRCRSSWLSTKPWWFWSQAFVRPTSSSVCSAAQAASCCKHTFHSEAISLTPASVLAAAASASRTICSQPSLFAANSRSSRSITSRCARSASSQSWNAAALAASAAAISRCAFARRASKSSRAAASRALACSNLNELSLCTALMRWRDLSAVAAFFSVAIRMADSAAALARCARDSTERSAWSRFLSAAATSASAA
mmetsp:Transcript_124165/g.359073  ORF Transcript_124165/g.359073 Transcript_124165/m.359073 type:complete len:244 (+) Transcript_124165:151-882(+)